MKKPGLAIIIADRLAKKKGSMSKPPMVDEDMHEPDEHESDDSDTDEMRKSAASDLLQALKDEDVDAIDSALRDFFDLCSQSGDYETHEE